MGEELEDWANSLLHCLKPNAATSHCTEMVLVVLKSDQERLKHVTNRSKKPVSFSQWIFGAYWKVDGGHSGCWWQISLTFLQLLKIP